MRRFIVLAMVTASLLGACGSSGHTNPTTTAARPQRILSLSATATSMLYGMGAGSQVVGVDVYSTEPKDAPRTKFTGFETSAEAFVPYHPDLLILAFDTGGKLMPQLATLHIPALLLPPAKSIDDTDNQIRQLGQATGHMAGATKEIATIGQQLDALVRSTAGRVKGRSYYHEVDNTLYTATSKTFIGALYARLGMVNVADAADATGSGFPQLSAEYLVQRDPDFVFLADTTCCHETVATFAARPGFSRLRAVRDGHVVLLDDALAAQWGPRVVDFLRAVADATAR